MRKFILMLAISLGGIVSTQAQSNTTFDFSCITLVPNYFTAADVVVLEANNFSTIEGQGNYQSNDNQLVVIEANSDGTYSAINEDTLEVVDDLTFQEALAQAAIFAGIPHGNIVVGGINFDTISYDEVNRLVGQIGTTYRIVLSTSVAEGSVHPADVVYSLQELFDYEGSTIEGNILTGTFQAGETQIGVYATSVRTGQTEGNDRIYGRVHLRGTN